MRKEFKVKAMYINALGNTVETTKMVDLVELYSMKEDLDITLISVNGMPAGAFFRKVA